MIARFRKAGNGKMPATPGKASRSLAAAAALAAILAGCSAERDPSELFGPSEEGTLVIDAVLLVDQAFPTIILTRALAPDEPFSLEAAGESDAAIVIREEGGDDIVYVESRETFGAYFPDVHGSVVKPLTRYDLSVIAADGDRLSATTTTPARFAIPEWLLLDEDGEGVRQELASFPEAGESTYVRNSLVFSDGLLEARFERPDVPAFHIGISSLDLESDFVVDLDFLDSLDLAMIERAASSPALSGEDGTIRLPWFAIFYQGRYKIRIHALDENWYDFVRSTPYF
ncbi:MAG: DUF4249 family protein, partial [Gemmatimonadetes bacterium]|nr:DUF4249 family protein [Gemmatimonadota bacterium]